MVDESEDLKQKRGDPQRTACVQRVRTHLKIPTAAVDTHVLYVHACGEVCLVRTDRAVHDESFQK